VAISTGLRWRFQSASSGDFRRPVQRKAIEVLDEDAGRPQTLALFPEDRSDAMAPDASIVQLGSVRARANRAIFRIRDPW